MTPARAWSLLLAAVVGFGPLAAIPLLGFDVPTASQTGHDSPAPPMRAGDTWTQTFYFPDRPVTGVALRPGTYGGGRSGQVTGRIETLYFAGSSSKPELTGREFVIDLDALRDNRWHAFHFAPLPPLNGAAGVLQLTGTALPDEKAFTLWRNRRDHFADGVFAINGTRQQGDLSFSILSRVRGLDAARMLKSRWQDTGSGQARGILWILLPALLWPAVLFTGLHPLLRRNGASRR